MVTKGEYDHHRPSTDNTQINTRKKNENIHILSYNAQSLQSEEILVEFEEALLAIKWDVIGLSDLRRFGENIIRRKNGNILFYIGETKGQ